MTEQDIFAAAIKLTGEQRAAFVQAACGTDSSLRQQVEALLHAHDETGGVVPLRIDRDVEPTQALPESAVPGTVIAGRYKLLEQIGEGGMGTVWLAEQKEPVKRKVAIKLVKPGMDSRAVLARFDAERQALALMDHPNIAKVFDGGMTDQSRPYFVMEFVKGVPLTDYCDQAKLSVRRRLELFVPICQAVQHAHQKGIIHRDLKPSNLLICLYDGKPVPKVIDFGLAKALHQSLTEHTLHTAHGLMVGTPLYMSPEQAEHNNLDVDTRTDIYSLGVILYELLTGTTPLERQQLKEAAYNEILRLIKEVEPPKPSTRLSGSASLPSVAAQRSIEPKQLTRSLTGDLDWIVMKALDKERGRRYETANGLARDVERFLNDEAVEASPPSTGYRLRKLLKRHKGSVVAASLILLALIAGITGTSLGLIKSARATKAEQQQRILAERNQKETLKEKQRALELQDKLLTALRSMTGEDVEKLIGEKKELGSNERAYLEAIAKRWQEFAAREEEDEPSQALRAEGHFRVARLWEQLGRPQEALGEFEQAQAAYTELAEQFPANPRYQRELAATHNNLANMLRNLGRWKESHESFERGIEVQRSLVEQYPNETADQKALSRMHTNLGMLLSEVKEFDQARREFEHAREGQTELVDRFPEEAEYQDDLGSTLRVLGRLLRIVGESDKAIIELEAARDIFTTLVKRFPDAPIYRHKLAMTQNSLGVLLDDLAKEPQARIEWEAARDNLETLVAHYPLVPDYQRFLATVCRNLGDLISKDGDLKGARGHAERARDLYLTLANQFPQVPDYKRELALAHSSLGLILAKLDERGVARAEFLEGLAIERELIKMAPSVAAYQSEFGASCGNFGAFVLDDNQPAESLEWLNLAVQTLQPIHEKEPREVTVKEYLRMSYLNRAQVHERLQEFAVAAKDWAKVVELSPPEDRSNKRIKLATALLRAGQVAESEAEVTALIKMWESRVQANPDEPAVAAGLAQTVLDVGAMYLWSHHYPEAIDWSERATRLWTEYYERWPSTPDTAKALRWSHWNRSVALHWQGRSAEAVAELDLSLRYTPDSAKPDPVMLRTRYVAKSGDHAAADATILELLKSVPVGPARRWIYWHAALAYSLCSESAKGDDKLHDAYADKAIALLRQAASAGVDYEPFRTEPDLAPLRDREDFKQLLESLQAAKANAAAALVIPPELAKSSPKFAVLDPRMNAVLGGEPAKDAMELLALGERAYHLQRFALAARWFGQALDRDATLSENRQTQPAYNAACCAALAASGQGVDEPPLDDAAKVQLRGQARAWLQTELDRWATYLESATAEERQVVVQTLEHWQADADLAGVRDAAPLAALPEHERSQWAALWERVRQILSSASRPAP